MKRSHVSFGAGIAVLVFLAACRGEGGETKPTPVAGPPTPSRTSVLPAVGSVTGLERALLTAQDMPSGWTLTARNAAKEGEERSSLCNTVHTYKRTEKMLVNFSSSQSATEPVVTHAVTQYEPGDAKRTLDDILQALQTCNEWQATGTDGKTYTSRLARLSMPNLGEQSAAFIVTETQPQGETVSALVLIRRGDVTSGLLVTRPGGGSVDAPMIERLARRADQKLAAMLNAP
jgi:hypothetical protein